MTKSAAIAISFAEIFARPGGRWERVVFALADIRTIARLKA
jgi:hypothetical protein